MAQTYLTTANSRWKRLKTRQSRSGNLLRVFDQALHGVIKVTQLFGVVTNEGLGSMPIGKGHKKMSVLGRDLSGVLKVLKYANQQVMDGIPGTLRISGALGWLRLRLLTLLKFKGRYGGLSTSHKWLSFFTFTDVALLGVCLPSYVPMCYTQLMSFRFPY